MLCNCIYLVCKIKIQSYFFEQCTFAEEYEKTTLKVVRQKEEYQGIECQID